MTKKKLLALLLTLVMTFTALPVMSVSATEGDAGDGADPSLIETTQEEPASTEDTVENAGVLPAAAAISPTAVEVFPYDNPLPLTHSLYKTTSYDDTTTQWASALENAKSTASAIETASVLGVVDLEVYDPSVGNFVAPETFAGTLYTFHLSSLIPQYTLQSGAEIEVWVSNPFTNGWMLLGNDPDAVVTHAGFGTFAVTLKTPPTPLATIPALPTGQTLYVSETYDDTSTHWQELHDLMAGRMIAQEPVVINTLVELNVFDGATNAYLTSETFAGSSYTFSMADLISNHNSSNEISYEIWMKSSATGTWVLISNDTESVTVSNGFGLFAVVERLNEENAEHTISPSLPQGQALSLASVYNSMNSQWINFQDFVNTKLSYAADSEVFGFVTMAVLDKNTQSYVPNANFEGTTYSFPLIGVIPSYDQNSTDFVYQVWLGNDITGGWIHVGDDPAGVITTNGFGDFAVLRVSAGSIAEPTPPPTETPKTGDDSSFALWIMTALFSVTSAVYLLKRKCVR